jgi:3-deoxy-manno-octulosonate cytidylyltransferase (CMP-KDO synthetase)
MILAVIPARYASTRFPGKPLVDIGGRTMIERVYAQVQAAQRVQVVVVATDDERIADEVRRFGGQVCMTRTDHRSGTDRCAEVAHAYPEAHVVLNVQGDEPFVQPEQIDLLVDTLVEAPEAFGAATLVKSIADLTLLPNPNVVKAVWSPAAGALYFSRHPVPYLRDAPLEAWLSSAAFFKHIGLYAFRRDTLLRVATLPPSPLEMAESLEQLRWLEAGIRIRVGVTELETIGIDTPEDLLKINI